MKRKGASMPHGNPIGVFQNTMFSIKNQQQDNNKNYQHNHNNHNHQLKKINYLLFLTFGLLLFLSIPCRVVCDEVGENVEEYFKSVSRGPEYTTTTEFDQSKRGTKKFGDKCENTNECGFSGSICDVNKKTCQCIVDLPATNQIDKCGKYANINETCFFNEQCEHITDRTLCRDGKCQCLLDLVAVVKKHGEILCEAAKPEEPSSLQYVDPAMIGILVVMALMFITICIVLRLFSRARWRENRTIFNTPNPRLMNVSLLRDNKLLHGHDRRGSKMSVRAPSRQPSMASLRPHSPNPSLGSRRGSRGSSNASATSMRSNRSINGVNYNGLNNEPQPKPIIESVTVEITEPKA